MSDALGYVLLAGLLVLIAVVALLAVRVGRAAARAELGAAPVRPDAHVRPDAPVRPDASAGAGADVEPPAAGPDAQRAASELAAARGEVDHERRRVDTDRAALARAEADLRAAQERLAEQRRALEQDRADVAADRTDAAADRTEASSDRAEAAADRTEAAADRAAAKERLAEADTRLTEAEQRLSEIAGLSRQQAADEVRSRELDAVRRESAAAARDIERAAMTEARDRARKIIGDAIARIAGEHTTESTVITVTLPSDDMKGRIIGREGRNIRTFESVTGVDLIIDEAPATVLLSCFDPVRREIARLTLESLVADGRIQPHRIEEAFARAERELEQQCERAARDAVLDAGIGELHPELMKPLGRLRFRTSYGQNVLLHLIESARIAEALADELGVPSATVKRAAFLHDIGKALTHETPGSHALIGADLARRYGEDPDVVHAIEAHHNEVEPRTIEAVLTQAADACSGGRPGARRESVEAYATRLRRIEEIAAAKDGVERVLAMQAGREIRVMVKPEAVDDLLARQIAREVAREIEAELSYPGQIRVTVIRESRATEIAQ